MQWHKSSQMNKQYNKQVRANKLKVSKLSQSLSKQKLVYLSLHQMDRRDNAITISYNGSREDLYSAVLSCMRESEELTVIFCSAARDMMAELKKKVDEGKPRIITF